MWTYCDEDPEMQELKKYEESWDFAPDEMVRPEEPPEEPGYFSWEKEE